MIRIDVDELILPDGRRLVKGDVVRTEEFPGLTTALAAGVAVREDAPAKSPIQSMKRK